MTSSVLKTQHVSLQFNDDRDQQKHDVEKLFSKGKQFPIKTGTEAGPEEGNDNLEFLKKFSKEFNHVLHAAAGNWIAVDKSIIEPGSIKRGKIFVAPSGDLFGRMHDRVFPTLSFNHINPRIGRVSQAAAHYPTKGQTKSRPNFNVNVDYAKKIERWMKNANSRGALSFVNGDFNMPDDILDWAFGLGWTSMADELKAWKNTGHGPIDGFASLDKDKRVKAKKFQVLGDGELKMFTDHFVCRGTWTIRHLKL